ncbi:hypothetical protein, partial [Nocardioides ultimimeridianus]
MPRTSWTTGATAATLTLTAVRARRRVAALPVLDEHPVAGEVAGYRLIAADGVHVTPATLAAAVAHARPRGLQVLDLVPADLPAERLLALLGQLDPATYAGDVLATGRTAGHAMVVSEDLLERTGVEPRTDLGELELTSLAVALKEHAPTRCAHALAPGLRARAGRDGAWERLRRAYGESSWIALLARVAALALLLRGARRGRLGMAALAAYQAHRLLATAGPVARPRGRWRDLLGRSA